MNDLWQTILRECLVTDNITWMPCDNILWLLCDMQLCDWLVKNNFLWFLGVRQYSSVALWHATFCDFHVTDIIMWLACDRRHSVTVLWKTTFCDFVFRQTTFLDCLVTNYILCFPCDRFFYDCHVTIIFFDFLVTGNNLWIPVICHILWVQYVQKIQPRFRMHVYNLLTRNTCTLMSIIDSETLWVSKYLLSLNYNYRRIAILNQTIFCYIVKFGMQGEYWPGTLLISVANKAQLLSAWRLKA